jgi:cysteine synthase A
MALNSSLDLIGNTPKIKLQKIVPENATDVWLKYEAVNPTGSYKNRMNTHYQSLRY